MIRLVALFFCFFASCAYAEPTPTVNQLTLSLIKPEAVRNNHVGGIIDMLEQGGLRVAGLKMVMLTQEQATSFYSVHQNKPYFNEILTYMLSGPIVAIVLEGPNAVVRNRELIGVTDPSKAAKGSIRSAYGRSILENAIHGSDSAENAAVEIGFFFKPDEIFPAKKDGAP